MPENVENMFTPRFEKQQQQKTLSHWEKKLTKLQKERLQNISQKLTIPFKSFSITYLHLNAAHSIHVLSAYAYIDMHKRTSTYFTVQIYKLFYKPDLVFSALPLPSITSLFSFCLVSVLVWMPNISETKMSVLILVRSLAFSVFMWKVLIEQKHFVQIFYI